MAEFVRRFFPPGAGHHVSLEALTERVRALTSAVVGQGAAEPLTAGPWRPVVQDLAWRLLQIRSEADGAAAAGIADLVDHLADEPDAAGISAAIAGYEALHAEFFLPPPSDVFAVGYSLPGGVYGRSVRQLAEGLSSACPDTLEALGEAREAVVARFVAADAPARVPLGRRFARFLATEQPGAPVAGLVAFEAAISHAQPRDAAELTLGWDDAAPDADARVARGVEIVDAPPGVVGPAAQPVAVLREVDGAVSLVPLDDATAGRVRAALAADAAPSGLAAEPAALLREAGVLVPTAWRVSPR